MKHALRNFAHTLFIPTPDATKLLTHVSEANYEAARILVAKNPALIFQAATLNEPGVATTPLKLSLKLLDTYMWKKIFLPAIQDDAMMMEQFWLQAHEPQEPVQLTPLFEAYNHYKVVLKQLYSDWQDEGVKIQLEQAWLAIGMEQRNTLPSHMLREFCRGGQLWHRNSLFNVDEHPAPTPAIGFMYGGFGKPNKRKAIKPFRPNKGLGYDYALENGGNNPSEFNNRNGAEAAIEKNGVPPGGCTLHQHRFDFHTFQRLYLIRQQDLANLMLLSPQQNQQMVANHP